MDDKASVGKISVSSDSVSTLNSEDFVLVSRQGDETPSTNNGSDDEKTGLKLSKIVTLLQMGAVKKTGFPFPQLPVGGLSSREEHDNGISYHDSSYLLLAKCD
uniref:RAB GTPase activating protein 1 n=1 Tax=Equus caballus TaxID=9796 RepID=A0A9L0R7Z6_HORSE